MTVACVYQMAPRVSERGSRATLLVGCCGRGRSCMVEAWTRVVAQRKSSDSPSDMLGVGQATGIGDE